MEVRRACRCGGVQVYGHIEMCVDSVYVCVGGQCVYVCVGGQCVYVCVGGQCVYVCVGGLCVCVCRWTVCMCVGGQFVYVCRWTMCTCVGGQCVYMCVYCKNQLLSYAFDDSRRNRVLVVVSQRVKKLEIS